MKVEINLWELMWQSKMTAIRLSKVTWLTPVQISHIKNGKTTKIGLDTMAKLLEAFECTPNELLKITK